MSTEQLLREIKERLDAATRVTFRVHWLHEECMDDLDMIRSQMRTDFLSCTEAEEFAETKLHKKRPNYWQPNIETIKVTPSKDQSDLAKFLVIVEVLRAGLNYYANHESVIGEAYHSNDERQITVVHTFINHKANEALAKADAIAKGSE